jgi:cell wall integrity and stress response component
MPSMTLRAARTFTLFALLAAMVHAAAAASPDEEHARLLTERADTYEGCYSSSTPLDGIGPFQYQSVGACSSNCTGSAVFAMSEGDACWCGDELPALSDKVDKSECDTSCVGFPSNICGGNGLWSVYTTESGVKNYGGSDSDPKSSSSSSSSAASSSTKSTSSAPTRTTQSVFTSTNGAQTVVVTVPATADATATSDASQSSAASREGSGSGGSNTAGIAAGVVVGVVAIAALIGGVYFFLRRRKRIAAEEEFKQRTQVSDFMRGGDERKPPATGYSAMSDARLDPEAGRRDSVGSLADNQDYSRRILRVANPSD